MTPTRWRLVVNVIVIVIVDVSLRMEHLRANGGGVEQHRQWTEQDDQQDPIGASALCCGESLAPDPRDICNAEGHDERRCCGRDDLSEAEAHRVTLPAAM